MRRIVFPFSTPTAVGVAVALMPALSASAQCPTGYQLGRYTVDGGGATFTVSGGTYSLGATIGQADAGLLAGGDYALYGGFWRPRVGDPPTCAPCPPCGPKNRYLSFNPANGPAAVSFKVTRVLPSVTEVGWVGDPINVPDGPVSHVVPAMPAPRAWTESEIHVGDCEIIPVATFEIRTTTDGVTYSAPFEVSTIAQPVPKYWGDTVGQFGVQTPGVWDPPNGVVNVNDFVAALEKFQNPATTRVHLSVVDVVGAGLPGLESCLNRSANIADVFNLIKAFQGADYPFTKLPATCPPSCP